MIKIAQTPVKISTSLTPKQIRRKRTNINAKIEKLHEQLRELKTVCEHPDVTKKYGGSTGNYDPSCDAYWIDWACSDCGKKWTTDQDRENNLKPGRIIK